MDGIKFKAPGYILAALLGAAVGGAAVAVATRAIPEMMSRMMYSMRSQMNEEGCDPEEM